jgi:DNA-binding response OmpR family regulator
MKVLLVEDNDIVRAGYLTQLEQSGLPVELFAAGSVDDAMRTADLVHPDMIFLDLHLGTGQNNGLEVFDHVRRQAYGEDTYVVAVTARSTSDVKNMLESRGFNRILFKADYHYGDDEIIRIVEDQMSSQRRDKPASSPAGPAARSDEDKFDQAMHDLSELIWQKGPVWFSEKKRTELKRLVQSLDGSHTDNDTLEVAERNITPPNLLIVEDDVKQQAALAGFLKAAGYRVTVANGISDARARMSQQNFDAYIVDLLLQHGEKGTDISRLLTAGQSRNVVFTTARLERFEELQREGARVYYKPQDELDKLLALVRQVAPLRSHYLVSENEVAVRGKRLLKDIEEILKRDQATSSTDSDVVEKCKAFADWVLQLPSVDTNKYIVASEYLARAIKRIEGIPFMATSRRICVESHSRIYEQWLYRSRWYFSWFVHRVLWGGITGYGYSLRNIAAAFGIVFAVCVVLMAMNPEAFRFLVNNRDLVTMTGSERWWSSAFIAGCHALLVSTETAAPVSIGAQVLTLLQTIFSVLMLGLLVGAITFRIKGGS